MGRRIALPKLLAPKKAVRGYDPPVGPKCIDPECDDHRGESKQWTSCRSCDEGGPLCPKHVHAHFATHVKRPVECHIVRKPRADWG